MRKLAMVACLSAVISSHLAAQAAPDYYWCIGQVNDTTFGLPVNVAVSALSKEIFVADSRRPGIVRLNGANGTLRDVLGRDGSGPAEFISPMLVSATPSGDTIGVYDARHQAVIFLTRDGREVSRLKVSPNVWNAKALQMLSGGAALIAGPLVSPVDTVFQVHRVDTDGVTDSGGPPVAPSRQMTLESRRLIAGGLLRALPNESMLFAEASTGNVYGLSAALQPRLLANGPGATDNLFTGAVERSGGQIKFWWSFPKPVLLWALDGDRYMIAWSVRDAGEVHFYELSETGLTPKGVWHEEVLAAAEYDNNSAVVIARRSSGEFIVGRAAYPFAQVSRRERCS